MAAQTLGGETTSANPLTFTLSPGMAPAAPLLRLLSRLDRSKVEAFAEVSVALLDLMDGDPDLEDDDPREEDDPAGQYDEDMWSSPLRAGDTFDLGPGCPISDPDHGIDDLRHDPEGDYDSGALIAGGGED